MVEQLAEYLYLMDRLARELILEPSAQATSLGHAGFWIVQT